MESVTDVGEYVEVQYPTVPASLSEPDHNQHEYQVIATGPVDTVPPEDDYMEMSNGIITEYAS